MPRRLHPFFVFAIVLSSPLVLMAEEPSQADREFESRIAPLLASSCVECHNARDHQGGLDLTRESGLQNGGDSGPVVDHQRPDQGELWKRIAAGSMPPPLRGQPRPLKPEQLAVLQRWLSTGSHWPDGRELGLYERTTEVRAGLDWWSFQPIQRPALPSTNSASSTINPVDAFVRQRLQEAGFEPAPRADRRTLIRRAYLDLIGLPPTAAEIDAFIKDANPDAWERLIDQLLASEHYGERWARYWLDVVRFAETSGYERDQLKTGIWRYRDWVIKAFNEDLPYDQFVVHQLAGDEVPNRDIESVTATGMLRAGTWNDEPNDPADYVYERLEDLVHSTSTAFMGLTVKCARCHDHKFDPIPQEDYYRIGSFFWAGYMGQQNLGGPSADQLGFDRFGWTDKGPTAEPLRLLFKGERHQPGEVIEPGFLSAVTALDAPLAPPPASATTTTRRLQFARWLTNPQHPLTARVFVNRVWLHHFGQGIVRTPDDFGFNGAKPTHPALLDWLAAELMEPQATHGVPWSVKRLHKLIMLSQTYQQSSLHPQAVVYEQTDSANELLWRFNRRRLDAEALRDSLLMVSGQIKLEIGGESFYPELSAEALEGLSQKDNAWGSSPADQRARRSIYMLSKRSRLLPMMTAFDMCDTTAPCGKRDVTIVAPQALALLNNDFVHTQSVALAERVAAVNSVDLHAQIKAAWMLTLGREPTEIEVAAASKHLKAQAERFALVSVEQTETVVPTEPSTEKLKLWLRADRGLECDEQDGITFWQNQVQASGLLPLVAFQNNASARPRRVEDAINGMPALRFNGMNQFMQFSDALLTSPEFSIVAVVLNRAEGGGPREIVSNWDRRDRSTSSVFLGVLGDSGYRFSDALNTQASPSQTSPVTIPAKPTIVTAVNSSHAAAVFQNRTKVASNQGLPKRDLSPPYVLGTQGNYGHEYWQGDIAELIVYERALAAEDCEPIWNYLENRYGIESARAESDVSRTTRKSPEMLALASLCHVLLNTNEFIYVD